MTAPNSLTSYTNVTEVARSTVFQFGTFQLNVVTDESGVYWFNANEVCNALEFTNSRKALSDHVDEDDVTKRDTIDNLGRTQQSNHVNESGLYALVFGSNLESAKKFKRWVTSEVLPAIRKTGSYTQVTEAARAQLMIEVKHDYAENLKHSIEYELGDAVIRAVKRADQDNETILNEALVGLDFDGAAKSEGKGRTGKQVREATLARIKASSFVDQLRTGNHTHPDVVLDVLQFARFAVAQREANENLTAFRLGQAKRPTTFQRIEADDFLRKHDNPIAAGPAPRKKVVRKRS